VVSIVTGMLLPGSGFIIPAEVLWYGGRISFPREPFRPELRGGLREAQHVSLFAGLLGIASVPASRVSTLEEAPQTDPALSECQFSRLDTAPKVYHL